MIFVNQYIKNLLLPLDVKELPNNPNVSGVFEQTDITYAIKSGKYLDTGYVELTLNVSVAAERRTSVDEQDEKKSLDDLTFSVVKCLHNKKIPNCKVIRLNEFENFTPDSGKWRTLISFTIPYNLMSDIDVDENCLIG